MANFMEGWLLGLVTLLIYNFIKPFLIGLWGYQTNPVLTGTYKIRDLLKRNSTEISERVPDIVCRTLAQRALSLAEMTTSKAPERMNAFVRNLELNANALIVCLESKEINRENEFAFDLIKAMGINLSAIHPIIK